MIENVTDSDITDNDALKTDETDFIFSYQPSKMKACLTQNVLLLNKALVILAINFDTNIIIIKRYYDN